MASKTGFNNFRWLATGALIQIAIIGAVLYFHNDQNPAAQIAFKAKRVEMVTRMRLELALAADAEKSAVMATTDKDSQSFADQARAAAAAVERGGKELGDLLKTGGAKDEADLLARFSGAFAEFQILDKELLDLAVQNTNLKAYSLAYGPAADSLRELDAALSRIVTANADSTATDARQIMQLADDCRVRALRIQTLIPPHIAEGNDEKMDELETQMAKEDEVIRKDLEALAALLKPGGNSDIETSASRYAGFTEIEKEIVKLSRQNTNVRSLTTSLTRKSKATLMCQDALAALEQAIKQEPISGLANEYPVYPR